MTQGMQCAFMCTLGSIHKQQERHPVDDSVVLGLSDAHMRSHMHMQMLK